MIRSIHLSLLHRQEGVHMVPALGELADVGNCTFILQMHVNKQLPIEKRFILEDSMA